MSNRFAVDTSEDLTTQQSELHPGRASVTISISVGYFNFTADFLLNYRDVSARWLIIRLVKVTILAPLEHTLGEPAVGGLEKHTVQLASGLRGLGHQVTLLARPGSWTPAGVDYVPAANYRAAIGLLRGRGCDVIHNNSIHFLPILAAFTIPRPVVTTLHVPPFRRLIPGTLACRILRGSTFVSISNDLAQQWIRYAGDSIVIHNGVDLEQWKFEENPIPKTAIWFGRMVPEKGAEYAIAAARSASFRLRLAGRIEDQTYFDAKIAPNLYGDITYIGHLSQKQLSDEAGKASVGLYTSVWREPFGLILPEMLATGTPVAGFATGAVEEIITPSTGRLVEARNAKRLAAVMREVTTLDRYDCRKHVTDNFSIHRMVYAYENLYKTLL